MMMTIMIQVYRTVLNYGITHLDMPMQIDFVQYTVRRSSIHCGNGPHEGAVERTISGRRDAVIQYVVSQSFHQVRWVR